MEEVKAPEARPPNAYNVLRPAAPAGHHGALHMKLMQIRAAVPALAAVLILWGVWRVLQRDACGQQGTSAGPGRKPLPPAGQIAALPADGGAEFNRLIHEASPYLLQHARNPVDWHPWGPAAFAKAKKEGKPVFLSVGYSTCHWCHVMEHESFEHADVAKLLNEHFVAIKVDREERPEIDHLYMLATQLLTGRGGWPNSVWLTPDSKPWYAGTYFPREDRGGMSGFQTVLTRLAEVWRTRRKEVGARADEIAQAVARYAAGGHVETTGRLSYDLLDAALREAGESFDEAHGGFGGAPKFPPHGRLRLLRTLHRRTGDANALRLATRTLDAMALGGIRDHVAGGFHRYATDAVWLVPHFEKMLYDNAQLARAYADAHAATGEPRYRRVAVETFDWALREMRDPAGGFHSALDADSEGEEGKFYLWTRQEVLDVLGADDGERFCRVYGITAEGNFRDPVTGERPGTNIPHLAAPVEDHATREKLSADELRRLLTAAREKLLARRGKRVWPGRDDKVLTSWNALMISSLAHGGRVLKEPRYVDAAGRAADFILTHMRKGGRLLHTWRGGRARLGAYLDDYAFLADALLELHAATGEARRLREAQSLADELLARYADASGGGFFFTADDHEKLLARAKEPTDGPLPSGNAVAAEVLVRLAGLTGRKEYLDAAGTTLEAFQGFMARMPAETASMVLAAAAYLDAKAAGAPPARKPDAVADRKPVRIEAFASRRKAAPGETIDVELRLTIDKGWHVNSHRPLGKDLVATTVALAKGSPAALGEVDWPPGTKVKLELSPEALRVYEGTVRIAVPVRLAPAAAPGPAKLALTVTTQACNDRTCLAPATATLALPVEVERPGGR